MSDRFRFVKVIQNLPCKLTDAELKEVTGTRTSTATRSSGQRQMSNWQHGKPPNEQLVEVEHEREIIRVRAIWGRDGLLPHWESEDRGILWSPDAFHRWRVIGSGNQGASAKRAGQRAGAHAPK